jgi:hypothetical protein
LPLTFTPAEQPSSNIATLNPAARSGHKTYQVKKSA